MSAARKVEAILPSPPVHWVGDGFPVRSVFSPQVPRVRLSPYILMDYAAPSEFLPASEPRGVGSHPHRGFETVTVVYQGEIVHRDSAGNGGRIGPGDVQWMTAARGVLHEEKHSPELTRSGGVIEMAQLWVNLPARDKLSPPRYQTLLGAKIPTIELGDGGAKLRLIAGELEGTRGAAETFTPVVLWDATLRRGAHVRLPIPDGYTAAVFTRSGTVRVGGTHPLASGHLATFERTGTELELEASEGDAELLVIGGEPIDEPVVAYGPFVMNTMEEIAQAIADFQAGRLGELE
jgi:redox-sensitive bicupin YhaK (pirin superfamily)